MPVTASSADELVERFGWTRNEDGSVTSKSGRTTQVIGESVEVVNTEYNSDKTAGVVTYSDGTTSSFSSGGNNVYAEGTVEKDGFTVTDYTNRYKVITGAEANKIKPGSVLNTSGYVVWDAVNGKPQTSGVDAASASQTASGLNSFAHQAEISSVSEGVQSARARGIPTQAPTRIQAPTTAAPAMPTPTGSQTTQPSTATQQLGAGQVAAVNPAMPQTVTQQVAPITYQDAPQTVTATPATGTAGQPVQTAGMSAVPGQVSYKTHYAGTQGAVPETLVLTQPGTGGQPVGSQVVSYRNNLGQTILVTEFNGVPTTYVPPGFERTVQAAKGGYMKKGYDEGGLVPEESITVDDSMSRILDRHNTISRNPKPNSKAVTEFLSGMELEELYSLPFEQWTKLTPVTTKLIYSDAGDVMTSAQWDDFFSTHGDTIRQVGRQIIQPGVTLQEKNKLAQSLYNLLPTAGYVHDRSGGGVDKPTQPVVGPTGPTTPTDPTVVTEEPVNPYEVTEEPFVSPTTGVSPTTTGGTEELFGTTATPLQTAGLSAIPEQVTYKTNYAGTQGAVPQTLTLSQPGVTGQSLGSQQVMYENDLGQTISVTEFNGSPITYVPPGFKRVDTVQAARGAYINGYNQGGDIELEGKYRVYTKQFGYTGPKTREALEQFEEARPEVKRKGMAIGGYVRKFNRGGVVKGYQEGGLTKEQLAEMQASAVTQTMQPVQSNVAMIQPTAADFIPVDAGQTVPLAPYAEAATTGTVQQALLPETTPASLAGVTTAAPQVQAETAAMQAAQGVVSPEAQVEAAQQETSSVSQLKAEQGTAIMMDNPVQREIQEGELISGAANAAKAAEFTEQIEAATAEPSQKATVAGQLEGLMQQFEGGNTPPWAAGSMRTAMASLSARGLGASSLAGQAVIQAAMEAALPIAQIDAATQAQFESQNLSNRQQRAILAAQQRATFLGQEFDQAFQARVANSARIGDIANMNFTAEQSIALENSRAANTVNLQNLSNSQAMVMAEAAALANLDMSNLSNRQQSAVQNAQNFLQMDMANLSNEQQTAMFKSQQNIQALFTDQAAQNAAAQFNASSENQTNQFFANLSSQTAQFNASQQNAMDQFNVNSVNALREFNSELQQQRDIFNAQNGLVIAQANAQWRQNIATINTAAQNQSNMDFAKTINGLTAANMDQIWQRERDIMSFAFASAESAADRAANIAVAKLTAAEQTKLQDSIGKGKLAAIAVDAVVKKWLG